MAVRQFSDTGRQTGTAATHALELVLHALGVVLDEDLLALADEALSRARVEVQVDAVLLVAEARLGLLHVLGDAVGREVLLRLGRVERLGRGEERHLERRAVHLEILPVRVGLVEPERDCGARQCRASVNVPHCGTGGEEGGDAPNESMTFLTRSVSIVSPMRCFSMSLRTAVVSLLPEPLWRCV